MQKFQNFKFSEYPIQFSSSPFSATFLKCLWNFSVSEYPLYTALFNTPSCNSFINPVNRHANTCGIFFFHANKVSLPFELYYQICVFGAISLVIDETRASVILAFYRMVKAEADRTFSPLLGCKVFFFFFKTSFYFYLKESYRAKERDHPSASPFPKNSHDG